MALSLLTASNNATSTLASTISNVALTCTLSAGSGALFPTLSANQYFLMTFVDAATGTLREIVRVTAISGDTCTIVRAQEGTTALAWNADDLAVNMITAGTILAMSQAAQVQGNVYNFAIGTGSANSYIATVSPLVTPAADGIVITFKSPATNTGASTLTFNGLAAAPIVSQGNLALQGGEIVANGLVTVAYNSTYSAWQIIASTGGALAIAPAITSHQAVQYSQLTGIVGATRNAAMSIATVSASATFTADEIIVETALGGIQYRLSNFSKTINLATTGAGGMDTGLAPASGYVALYAIYNPTTAASALLAVNATSVRAPEIYAGANAPAGYTVSGLVSVWGTNASGQFNIGFQHDREIVTTLLPLLSTTGGGASNPFYAISLAVGCPKNAVEANIYINVSSSSVSNAYVAINISAALTPLGYGTATGVSAPSASFSIPILTAQTLYQQNLVSSGTATYTIYSTGYTF